MKSIVILSLLVAAANANGYEAQQMQPMTMVYQMVPHAPSSYGGQSSPSYGGQSSPSYGGQSTPAYGGQRSAPVPVETVRVSFSTGAASSDSSYGSSSSAPVSSYGQSAPAAAEPSYGGPSSSYESHSQSHSQSYSAPAAAPETVRVSYNSNNDQSSYGASSAPAQSSYGASSAPAQSYSAPSAPVETVRVSYNSNNDQSSYGASSAPAQSSYGASSTPAQSYSAPSAPVETVRVSYNSNNDQSSYGASSAPAQSSYGASSAPAQSSYGASSTPAQSYSAQSAPVETVRVSYSSNDQSSYGASSAPAQSSYGASSAPSSSYGSSNNVPILRHNQNIQAGTSHQYDYATGDGISHSETTSVRQGARAYGSNGESNAEITKQGQYSYTSPEGQAISLNYQADSQGFRAQGEHLPTSPPIPVEIAKSLRGYGGSSYSSGY